MIDLGFLAEQLQNARCKKGLSQEEAAEIIGVSAKTVWRYEKDGIRDLVTLDKVCEVYGLQLSDVLSGQNDLVFLAAAIKRLGPDACDVLTGLCKSMKLSR
jgi:transcriptional regulator with XRE-family HTH domain